MGAKPAATRSPKPAGVAKSPKLLPEPDVAYARQVVEMEAQAVARVSARLNVEFAAAVKAVLACPGRVVVTGMGKAGYIAQRLSALLSSTGTPSLYLHPADAVHGDLGRVIKGDLVVAISNSGATEEILRLMPTLARIGVGVIAVTGRRDSLLAKRASWVIDVGPTDEACPMGLVPTASSAALHAAADALCMTVAHNRPLSTEEYARIHPGGSLGRRLMRVEEVMRTGESTPLVQVGVPLRKVLLTMTNTPGRPGCALVTSADGVLQGIFTDGDLRRLLEAGQVDLNEPVERVMTRNPVTVSPDSRITEAAGLLRARNIDQVPVISADHQPIGLLDVQDLLNAGTLA